MATETRTQYQEELDRLEASALGGLDLVNSALERTLEAVEHQDVELAQLVVADDDRIDGRYLEVHQALITLLATQSPVATDLRLISALLHVLKSVERMGDQCVNICKMIPLSGNEPPADREMVKLILSMGGQTKTLIGQAKRAFAERDVELAHDLVRQDDVVDNLNRECFRLALEIGDDADRREWAMTMLLGARAIERIADNSVDIGEQVAFVVTGLFREFEDASRPSRLSARLRSAAFGNMHGEARDALRCHRYRLQHDARARRRACRRPAEEGDGATGLHADQQGARLRRGDSSPPRSRKSATWSPPKCGWRGSWGRRRFVRWRPPPCARRPTARRRRAAIGDAAGVPVDVLSDEEEGRLSFIGATKTLGHPVEGKVGVVDVGGGSTEVILGTVRGGATEVRSWRVGSGVLADELISSDPPSAAEIRKVRDRIDDIFEGVEIDHPAQAVAVGGSATSLRRLVGAVLEYETLERGIRVLCGDPAADVARRFELDPERVRILTTGVLLLEKVSELLGQPLQIGKGGLREGVILDLLNGSFNDSSVRVAA